MKRLICGPPGAGKTTYVRENMAAHDIVFDLDSVWDAFTRGGRPANVLPFVLDLREWALEMLGRMDYGANHWFIACAPERKERNRLREVLRADEVVIIKPKQGECWERVRNRKYGREQVKLVDKWFHAYQPGNDETVVS